MENHARLRALMRDQGLDALVAGTPENVFYLSGVRLLMQRLIPNRFSFVLLTADRSTLITVHSDADHARRDATVDAVLEYGHTAPPLRVLSQASADAGLGRGRIGIETGFIPVSEFTGLSQSLRGGELVAAEEIFQQARMRKNPDEIERLRCAQHRTELAVTAAMAMSQEGDTERQMAQKIGANLFAYGAEAVDFILLTIGINSTVFTCSPDPTGHAGGTSSISMSEAPSTTTGRICRGTWASARSPRDKGTLTPGSGMCSERSSRASGPG